MASEKRQEQGRIAQAAALWRTPRILDGTLVLDDEDIVLGYEIRPTMNPITAHSADVAAVRSRFETALRVLGLGERVQIIVHSRAYDPSEDLKKINGQINDNAAALYRVSYPLFFEDYLKNYCQATMVPRFSYYMMFSFTPPKGGLEGNVSMDQNRKFQETKRRAESFLAALMGSSLEIAPLSQHQLLELLDASANPSRLGPLDPKAFDSAPAHSGLSAGAAELLYRSPIAEGEPIYGQAFQHLWVGSKAIKTIGFNSQPHKNMERAVEGLMMMGLPFSLVYHIEGMSQGALKTNFEKKREDARGAIAMAKGKNTDKAEAEIRELSGILDQMATGALHFVNMSVYLSAYGRSGDEALRSAVELRSQLNDMTPDEGLYHQLDYWRSTLPLGENRGRKKLKVDVGDAAALFPFWNFKTQSPEGGALVGFSPANEPCWIAPWSKVVTNPNWFVTGKAGSGKSFVINLIQNRLGAWGWDLTFIDKAKSYRTTCLAMDGDYIELDLAGQKHAVNVFDVLNYDGALEADQLNDLVKVKEGGYKVGPAKLEQVAGLAEILLAEVGGSLGKLERSLLVEDIKLCYDERLQVDKSSGVVDAESVPTFSDLAATIKKVLADAAQDPRHQEKRRDTLQILKSAIEGPLQGLVNQRTTLQSKGRVRVFDLSNLGEGAEIQGVAMYLITTWLYRHWARNKAKNLKQICVVDEVYMMMQFPEGRKLLANLARRSRHMGLVSFFATQQLTDVMKYPDETKAIMDNAEVKLIFKQPREVVNQLVGLLGLTDQEAARLESLDQVKGHYSQAFTIYGSQRNVLTIRPDPVLRWICTSDTESDLPRVAEALKASGNEVWQAVFSLIDGKF
jgi:hypothetical protein